MPYRKSDPREVPKTNGLNGAPQFAWDLGELIDNVSPDNPNHSNLHGVAPQTVEVVKNEYCYEVTIEVGDAKYEDLRVELNGHLLVIRCGASTDDNRMFEQAYVLPDDAIRSEILASFDTGILTVFVPREQAATHKEAKGEDSTDN